MGLYNGPKTAKLKRKDGVLYVIIGDGDPRRMPSVEAAIHWAEKFGCVIPQEQVNACRS